MATLIAYRGDGSIRGAEALGEEWGFDLWRDDSNEVAIWFGDVRLWPDKGQSVPNGCTFGDAMGAWARAEALRLVTINGEQVWPLDMQDVGM